MKSLPDKKLAHKAPHLESERLYMRPLNLNDENICSKMGWKYRGTPIKTVADARKYLRKITEEKTDGYYLGVFLKETNELIGDLEFCHMDWYRDTAGELCYGFKKEHWGKGYATESASCLVDYLFRNVNMHKVTADTDPDNYASQNVLKKLYFIHEGTSRKKHYDKESDSWDDELNWGLLKEEWLKKQKRQIYKIRKK